MIDVDATMCDGTLTIDGVLMHRRAFAVLDIGPFLVGAPQRGEDTTIPGRPGVLSNPRRDDVASFSLRMVIDGDWTPEGLPAADPRAQFWLNVKWLGDFVSDPTYLTDGTRIATVVTADGRTLTGPVTVGPLQLGTRSRSLARAALGIVVPAGRLTES